MKLRHSVLFLLLSASPYTNADILEGSLGFSGMVTETTCTISILDGENIQSPPTERFAGSVTLSLKQCPDKILRGTAISLRDVSTDVPFPDFILQSGEKIVKGDNIDHSLFSRENVLNANLPLILSHPLSGGASSYSAVFHLNYD